QRQDTPFFAHPFAQARFFLLLPDPRRFPLSFPAALLLETEHLKLSEDPPRTKVNFPH
ncbi:MAG: hypothetical protein RIS76_802, partial [Verrucomicrobiota bacterium]